jgi:hypothetical protein
MRDAVLEVMQAHPLGRDAAMIGTVTEDDAHLVEMKPEIGGTARGRLACGRAIAADLLTAVG